MQYHPSLAGVGAALRGFGKGEKSPREKINEAFNYIERSKSADHQQETGHQEMFGHFDS